MSAVRSPGLKVRTPAFQAGGIGFKSRRSYCDHSEDRFPLVTPRMGMPSGEVAMVRWTMFSNDRSGA